MLAYIIGNAILGTLMGRVFDWEQVCHHTDTIPGAQDFVDATTNFGAQVQEEIEKDTIVGAVVFGSAALGTTGYRSDFDCVLTPHNHSPRSQDALDRVVAATNASGNIEVNPILHSRARLASGNHEIDRFFGQHLMAASRLVYGVDPAQYIQFANHDARTIVMMYLEHKKRSTAHGMTPSSPDYLKGLQRTLELPLAIGRKALRALDEVNGTSFGITDSANRALITPAVLELFENLELDDTAKMLLDLDGAYSELLAAAIDGSVTEKEYQSMIAEIRTRVSDASEWLDKLSVTLNQKLTLPEKYTVNMSR